MSKANRLFGIIGFACIMLYSFFMALNISSFQDPSMVNELRENLIQNVELQLSNLPKNQKKENDYVRDAFLQDLKENLVEPKYKLRSLYGIIGNIIILLGVVFIRRGSKLGLHFFISGTIFIVLTGFYALGAGITGWSFNLMYIILGIIFTPYFYYNLKKIGL